MIMVHDDKKEGHKTVFANNPKYILIVLLVVCQAVALYVCIDINQYLFRLLPSRTNERLVYFDTESTTEIIINDKQDNNTSLQDYNKLSLSRTVDAITNNNNNQSLLFILNETDYVYKPGYDSAPIVIESHKLLFFSVPKVGCTVFKQLFRRMMGYKNYLAHHDPDMPHDPRINGLKYLSDYSLHDANDMLTSPDWTRAMFVREPKKRALSAYMDKMLHARGSYVRRRCCVRKSRNALRPINRTTFPKFCRSLNKRGEKSLPSFETFLTSTIVECRNVHWNRQYDRIENKYWPYINFIGHFENIGQDTKELLMKINAWEEYGKSGWVNNGTVFESNVVSHHTNSKSYIQSYYTPKLEKYAEKFYAADYNHELFGYTPEPLSDPSIVG